MQLMASRDLRYGGKNPLFQPLRAEDPSDPDSPQYRNQCCLRYDLADHAMCPSCPLLLAERKSGKRRKTLAE